MRLSACWVGGRVSDFEPCS